MRDWSSSILNKFLRKGESEVVEALSPLDTALNDMVPFRGNTRDHRNIIHIGNSRNRAARRAAFKVYSTREDRIALRRWKRQRSQERWARRQLAKARTRQWRQIRGNK